MPRHPRRFGGTPLGWGAESRSAIGLPSTLGIRFNALLVTPAGESQEETALAAKAVTRVSRGATADRPSSFRIQFWSKRILYADYFSLFSNRSRRPARDAR